MPDQLTDCARKAAEEIAKNIEESLRCYGDGHISDCDCPKPCVLFDEKDIAAIIEREMKGYIADWFAKMDQEVLVDRNGLDEIKRKIFEEATPCPK